MNNATHPLTTKIPAAIGILLITLIIVGAIIVTSRDMPSVAATMPTTSSHTAVAGHTYKDGTYTEVGSYSSPAGTEMITVTLTLANSTVTNSMVMRGANDPTASSYQSLFISGYKGKVEGKKLSDINLTNVSGSSLTPKGFMSALQQIEKDAQA